MHVDWTKLHVPRAQGWPTSPIGHCWAGASNDAAHHSEHGDEAQEPLTTVADFVDDSYCTNLTTGVSERYGAVLFPRKSLLAGTEASTS